MGKIQSYPYILTKNLTGGAFNMINKINSKSERLANFKSIEGMLEVYAQPIFDSSTLMHKASEALIRPANNVSNTTGGLVKMIEDKGLHIEFDEFVLETICKHIKEEDKTSPISVNVCKKTMETLNGVDRLLRIQDMYDIDPKMIGFEVNEKTNFRSTIVLDNARKIMDHGSNIIIDDYGMTDAVIYDIWELGITKVKMDKGMTDCLDSKKMRLIEEVKYMFDRLNVDVVFEGIETEAELEFVRSLGKCYIQGFILGKPMKLTDCTNLNSIVI